MPYVVCIERRDEFSARVIYTHIAGSCHTLVRLLQKDDPRVFPAYSLDYRRGVVDGPVVHNNDLEMAVSLRQNRRE
jgi:hypothetical protein